MSSRELMAAFLVSGPAAWCSTYTLPRPTCPHQPIAVLGAWLQAVLGLPAAAERWADAAERGSFQDTLPDGGSMEGWLALLRALQCRQGAASMRRDAQVARELLPAGTHWRRAALLLEGISILMEGDAERADPVLAHAYDVTSDAGGMPNAAAASTERALVAIGHGDWDPADTLVERALAIVRAGNLDEYAQAALVYPLAARCALHGGNVPAAREHLARAARLRPRLSYAIPFYAVQVRLEIVRAYLALGDPAGARAVMREVRDVFHQRPRLGVLPEQAAQLQATLDTVGAGPAGHHRSPRPSCGCCPCYQPTCPSARSASACTSPATPSRPKPSRPIASSASRRAAEAIERMDQVELHGP